MPPHPYLADICPAASQSFHYRVSVRITRRRAADPSTDRCHRLLRSVCRDCWAGRVSDAGPEAAGCPECRAAVGHRDFVCNGAMDAACANTTFQLQLLEGIIEQVGSIAAGVRRRAGFPKAPEIEWRSRLI